jgi:hypothetical protein
VEGPLRLRPGADLMKLSFGRNFFANFYLVSRIKISPNNGRK